MSITEIKEGDSVLARHIPAAVAWGNDGLSFFSQDPEYMQVGVWKYSANKELKAHKHNEVSREILWTQEVIFVKSGKIRADIYDSKKSKVAEIMMGSGDIIILLSGGHGYTILEDSTQVLEVKNGPYLGADIDRMRLEV